MTHTADKMQQSSVDYSIDDQNRLVYFNSRWNDFAHENESPHLAAENLTGQSLFSHISGTELIQLWQFIIDGIRERRTTAEFDYRCDSPQIKRYMKMRVSYSEGLVHFSSIILRTAAITGLKIFAANQARSKRLILACSWCKKIKAGETMWLEPEIAVERLQLLEHNPPPAISHGVCPACYSNVWDDFERQLKE
ncbi:MAG: hypothetical protein U1F27_14605 [Turneriella sp.]